MRDLGFVSAVNHDFHAQISGFVSPALTTAAIWTSNLAHWYSYVPIIVLLLIIPGTRLKIGLPIAVTLSASAILGPIILKNIFAIDRPNIDHHLVEITGYGYPSGHAMNAAVFLGICAIMMWRYSGNKPLNIGFTVFASVITFIVGLSRIYLGVHTATDVIGGYLAGWAVLCIAVLIEARINRGQRG